MSNEIVKYSNQFNAQALRKFTALDLDLLMAIAARVRDKEIDEVTFTFEELRQLAHVKKNLTDKELAARIVEVNDRLLACRFKFQDDSRTVQFTLFSGSGQSRHNVDDRSLTQLFVKTGVHRLRCRVITGNTYLVPAFVHLTAKARHL